MGESSEERRGVLMYNRTGRLYQVEGQGPRLGVVRWCSCGRDWVMRGRAGGFGRTAHADDLLA